MKKYIALLSLLPLLGVAQTKQFSIEGKMNMDTAATGKMYLSYNDNGLEMRDSSSIINNSYHFKGNIEDGAIRASIFWEDRTQPIKNRYKGFVQFFAVPGKVTVTSNKKFSDQVIVGSRVEDEAQTFKNSAGNRKEDRIAFIRSHPDSWLSVVFLQEMVLNPLTLTLNETDELIAGLSPALKKYKRMKAIMALTDGRHAAAVGNPAIDFTAPDVNGKQVSLSSYRGRYVLVDFWASWCHPCRAENPVMTAAYKQFKDKGFNVLNVSLDLKREAWINAVKQDSLVWTQVSNLKGFDDEAAVKYGVHAIPANFLIDPKGNIIAKDLRGEALHDKLAGIFK